jgi:uncharacterized protein YjiS (DUF1127 family)
MNATLCHTTSPVPAVALQPQTPAPRPGLRSALDAVFLWHERAKSRRTLATLDDRMLRDLGIDQATARREAAQPFWR